MLISDEYRKLNEDLHKDNKDFGTIGKHHALRVLEMAYSLNTQDILDYGCGKGTLGHNMPFKINQYDPAILKHSDLPKAADIVVCTDVLEHVEPECIDEVLDHIASLTKVLCYLQIANGKAKKILPDGRNAHLIQENSNWWFEKLSKRLKIISFSCEEPDYTNKLFGEFEEYIIVARPIHNVRT